MPAASSSALKPFVSSVGSAAAFVERDFLVAASYRTAFAADTLGIIFKVITFYYIGEVFGQGVAPSLARYGHDYFAFLMIGVALLDFVHTSFDTFTNSIRDSQMTGTLEAVLLSPMRLPEMIIYSSLWSYIFTALRFATYMVVGAALFGLHISLAGIPPALVALLLTILCFAPLGIISSAVIMVFKKGTWFQMTINGLGVLLGGVAYPVEVLPPWAARISYYLPLTHAVNAMRETLLNGKGLYAIRTELLFMAVFAAVMLPLALWIFDLGVRRTKQLGTLTQVLGPIFRGFPVALAVQTLALTKRYPRPRRVADVLAGRTVLETPALTDASITVEEGEVFGLLGPNGSGKTTLLKLLSTILSPSAGTARIFGFDVVAEPRRVRESVSLVTGEERSLYWRLTARQNLRFFASLHGIRGRQSRLKVDELLELFDLSHVADVRVSGFSTGMRQKLAIARGLLSGPRLLFLDEPTRGLDPVAAHTLLRLVRERAVERYDNTVILTTHIAREVEQLCRRITMLNRGTVVYQGTVEHLRASLERGQTYRVKVANLTPEILTALKHRIGAERCRVIDSDEATAELEIAFTDATTQLSDVLRQLLFSGVNIVQCTKREQSFEEIFRTVFDQGGRVSTALGAGRASTMPNLEPAGLNS